VAIHTQISDRIRLKIASGEWPPHYRLKSEPELAQELGVSRGTLRRALSTLIEEGLLRQVRGRGTFVTSTIIEPAIAQKLSTLTEDFARQGVVTETAVIACELMDPPKPVAALLEAGVGSRVLRLVRVQSLFGVLEQTYRLKIASARRTFSAEPASDEVSAALGLPEGAPVQYLQQVTYLDDDRPVEYSDVWIHSGRLQVTSLLSRR
jgi:GntR family transcriptional regulator